MELVSAESLFISQPSPFMFGNPANALNSSWTNKNWLKSRFHFSFAEYHDRSNSNFGCLRVMNDDLVQPMRGFGTHPHADMEIVTYIVDGQLSHKDSTGNQETLGRGSVQFMTAGKGLYHSESNDSDRSTLRFIQMWILPRTRGLDVNYGSFRGSPGSTHQRQNQWQHLVSDAQSNSETPVKIHQDCNIFVAEIDSGTHLEFNLENGRQAYVLMVESHGGPTTVKGDLATSKGCGDMQMNKHDALKVRLPGALSFAPSRGNSHVLIVEMMIS